MKLSKIIFILSTILITYFILIRTNYKTNLITKNKENIQRLKQTNPYLNINIRNDSIFISYALIQDYKNNMLVLNFLPYYYTQTRGYQSLLSPQIKLFAPLSKIKILILNPDYKNNNTYINNIAPQNKIHTLIHKPVKIIVHNNIIKIYRVPTPRNKIQNINDARLYIKSKKNQINSIINYYRTHIFTITFYNLKPKEKNNKITCKTRWNLEELLKVKQDKQYKLKVNLYNQYNKYCNILELAGVKKILIPAPLDKIKPADFLKFQSEFILPQLLLCPKLNNSIVNSLKNYNIDLNEEATIQLARNIYESTELNPYNIPRLITKHSMLNLHNQITYSDSISLFSSLWIYLLILNIN